MHYSSNHELHCSQHRQPPSDPSYRSLQCTAVPHRGCRYRWSASCHWIPPYHHNGKYDDLYMKSFVHNNHPGYGWQNQQLHLRRLSLQMVSKCQSCATTVKRQLYISPHEPSSQKGLQRALQCHQCSWQPCGFQKLPETPNNRRAPQFPTMNHNRWYYNQSCFLMQLHDVLCIAEVVSMTMGDEDEIHVQLFIAVFLRELYMRIH